jgi:hypothetical protein
VLARRRAVSEFLLYGVYATHVAPELVQPVTGSVCISEWGHDRVSEEQFVSLLVDGKPHQFALRALDDNTSRTGTDDPRPRPAVRQPMMG